MSIEQDYNLWSESYDKNQNETRDLDRTATQEILGNRTYGSILELGCGTGKNTEWLAPLSNRYLAIDFSAGMLAQARSKCTFSQVRFQQQDLNQPWCFDPAGFELATVNLVLEHISDLDLFMQQAAAHLQINGQLFVSELHPYRQYAGSQAQFEKDSGITMLEVYCHNVSDYIRSAKKHGLQLQRLDEIFDVNGKKKTPRLLCILFERV